jgi:hypothetical protein
MRPEVMSNKKGDKLLFENVTLDEKSSLSPSLKFQGHPQQHHVKPALASESCKLSFATRIISVEI